MGLFYERLIRPVLFQQDPERAHDLGVALLQALGRVGPVVRLMQGFNAPAGARPVELFGLTFPNRVGLAAGFDKNAQVWRAAPALGFGHVEIGTVTLRKQGGNPRPRLVRYGDDHALINRMGFNNDGAEAVANRLKAAGSVGTRRIPIGINIGKSKAAALDDSAEDYLGCFRHLADYADYFTINVSSPNTPELRRLQGADYLPELLKVLRDANRQRARKLGKSAIPMLVKISPDLTFRQIDDVLAIITELEIDGIVATNTTIARPGSFSQIKEEGGLSGKPLHRRSVEVVNYVNRSTSGSLPIIGVGGIDDPRSAAAMMDAGADLIQIYTGMIYRGPFLASQLARALVPRHSDWSAGAA